MKYITNLNYANIGRFSLLNHIYNEVRWDRKKKHLCMNISIFDDSVDGWNPAHLRLAVYPTYLQGLLHPRCAGFQPPTTFLRIGEKRRFSTSSSSWFRSCNSDCRPRRYFQPHLLLRTDRHHLLELHPQGPRILRTTIVGIVRNEPRMLTTAVHNVKQNCTKNNFKDWSTTALRMLPYCRPRHLKHILPTKNWEWMDSPHFKWPNNFQQSVKETVVLVVYCCREFCKLHSKVVREKGQGFSLSNANERPQLPPGNSAPTQFLGGWPQCQEHQYLASSRFSSNTREPLRYWLGLGQSWEDMFPWWQEHDKPKGDHARFCVSWQWHSNCSRLTGTVLTEASEALRSVRNFFRSPDTTMLLLAIWLLVLFDSEGVVLFGAPFSSLQKPLKDP